MLFLRLKAWFYVQYTIPPPAAMLGLLSLADKQRVLMPGHQGWNDLHSLCRIGIEYYLLNSDDNNDDDDDNNKDDDDDNRNNNNNDNDYNHNNDTNNDTNENDNDKNSSDSNPVTV